MTTFIPKAIWLALTTPQPRVNTDLDAWCAWAERQEGIDARNLAVLGFCYGGGKAIRYTTSARQDAATVVFYGSPLTDAGELNKLQAPVLGVFGTDDLQIPPELVRRFKEALEGSGIEHEVTSYDGVGHAFWKDMGQARPCMRSDVQYLALLLMRPYYYYYRSRRERCRSSPRTYRQPTSCASSTPLRRRKPRIIL